MCLTLITGNASVFKEGDAVVERATRQLALVELELNVRIIL